jgi:hypothetical protein
MSPSGRHPASQERLSLSGAKRTSEPWFATFVNKPQRKSSLDKQASLLMFSSHSRARRWVLTIRPGASWSGLFIGPPAICLSLSRLLKGKPPFDGTLHEPFYCWRRPNIAEHVSPHQLKGE